MLLFYIWIAAVAILAVVFVAIYIINKIHEEDQYWVSQSRYGNNRGGHFK